MTEQQLHEAIEANSIATASNGSLTLVADLEDEGSIDTSELSSILNTILANQLAILNMLPDHTTKWGHA